MFGIILFNTVEVVETTFVAYGDHIVAVENVTEYVTFTLV